MKRLSITLILGFLVIGCKFYPPDTDNTQSTALRMIPGVPIQDSINPSEADSVDWRMFVSDQDVRVTVVYTIGEAYKPHNVRGEIILFDRPGNIVVRKPIVPGKRDYTIMFTAHKQLPYYFKLEAKSGAAGYLINCSVEPLDPCSKCGPGTTCCLPTGVCCEQGTKCVAGQCVSRNVCDPPCGDGQVCEDGNCVSACPHRCGRGYRCDERLRQCIRVRRRHHHAAKHRITRPHCGAGQVYDSASRRCVQSQPQSTGKTIIAKVLNVSRNSSGGAKVILNKGYNQGVRQNNASARIGGHTFRLLTLFRNTSVWTSSQVQPDQVERYKSASIFIQ